MTSRSATRLRLGALCLLAAGSTAAAPPPDRPVRVYDPEIALLVLNIQKESLPLLASELKRQCEWLGLPGVKVLLDHTADEAIRDVKADLDPDSDILAGFRNVLVRYHPSQSREIDQLIGEIQRYHNLRPGPPLAKLRVNLPTVRSPGLIAEAGVGSDVENNLLGAQTIQEPVAAAQRRFGSTGPFLARRRWSLDFYLGDFRDLLPHYWQMGYRVFYRLRAPYISYSKEAYVLAPEGGTPAAAGLLRLFQPGLFPARARPVRPARGRRGSGQQLGPHVAVPPVPLHASRGQGHAGTPADHPLLGPQRRHGLHVSLRKASGGPPPGPL